MVQLIRSEDRFTFENDWLKTRWHFSFADYYDPANMNFGALRVFNDDVIGPAGGFPLHPHAEMEIITYVLDGELEHRDSSGGHGVLRTGDVQHMTAGRGIRHSEFNPSSKKPVHLLQIWIAPDQPGLAPGYEQMHAQIAPATWTPIASASGRDGALRLHQDATIYLARFAGGEKLTHDLPRNRKAYVFVISGDTTINGLQLRAGDQARITNERGLEFGAAGPADVMLIDLP